VEAGESGYSEVLKNTQLADFSRRPKTHKTIKLRLTGTYLETRDFSFAKRNSGYRLTFVSKSLTHPEVIS
jgi:hypothetical protein